MQKFNIHFGQCAGGDVGKGKEEKCKGELLSIFIWCEKLDDCHKLLLLSWAMTLTTTATVTVTVTVTVTASQAIRTTTSRILTENLLIPMNCGCPGWSAASPTRILLHVQNKHRRHLLNRQGIRLQLLPDSGVGRSERGEGAGAGEGEGVCNVFIFISLSLSPRSLAGGHFKLRIIVANNCLGPGPMEQMDHWTGAEQARAGCCLIRIYCVSRSWTALISGYGGRPASAAYVLNFVCTFKPASLDPQPLSSAHLPPPTFSPPAVRLQKSRSRRCQRRMRCQWPPHALAKD